MMMRLWICMLLSGLPAIAFTQQPFRGNSPDSLPPPFASPSVKHFSKVIGWKDGARPLAPKGFSVSLYADGFDNPRWMCVTPSGDLLVVESNTNFSPLIQVGGALIGLGKFHKLSRSADRITILRDLDKDGSPDQRDIFLSGLNQPFGMLFLGDKFYVANTDGLWSYPYEAGMMRIRGPGTKIIDLPAGKYNQHWTRNILAHPSGNKIYVAVGSSSNIGEHGMEYEIQRACILELNPDGSGLKVFARGLRNPVGMDWEPVSGTLWTVVNERDGMGDDLVPDYFTSVQEGGFYGWPYTYIGGHPDPRVKESKPAFAKRVIIPEVLLTAHSATLGLAFYRGKAFPEYYRNGAFLAQHGSFNRSVLSGYKVLFVPFRNGRPSGAPQDFLTGFIAGDRKVRGRPVGLTLMPDGALLLADDMSNIIWRIAYVP